MKTDFWYLSKVAENRIDRFGIPYQLLNFLFSIFSLNRAELKAKIITLVVKNIWQYQILQKSELQHIRKHGVRESELLKMVTLVNIILYIKHIMIVFEKYCK